MHPIFESIYYYSPQFIQNLAVTLFDLQYYKRRAGAYKNLKKYYRDAYSLPLMTLRDIQQKRLKDFLQYVNKNSSFHRERWKNINLEQVDGIEILQHLPIMEKEDLRKNIQEIVTIKHKDAYVGHTGGTTGKSLEVLYSWNDMQERMAILDSFREKHGYYLGKKIAWFSGKKLLNRSDELNKRYWKTDFWFNIRYYSTFHITPDTILYYIQNLNDFKPEYLSGFPSNIYELASFAKSNKIPIVVKPKYIFTTAETLLPEQVEVIEEQFQSKVLDHYSSSEGAPWIMQCEFGKYHYILPTGVIELLDKDNRPSYEGEAVITSFATRGTPLIRYRIGDYIKFAQGIDIGAQCQCGSYNPIVEKIEGRKNDFLYSRERGKINLGNVSNCVKYSNGVIKFQAIQETIDKVIIKLVVDPESYKDQDEKKIVQEFQSRLGNSVQFHLQYVEDIPKEKSGKYTIVNNTLDLNLN